MTKTIPSAVRKSCRRASMIGRFASPLGGALMAVSFSLGSWIVVFSPLVGGLLLAFAMVVAILVIIAMITG